MKSFLVRLFKKRNIKIGALILSALAVTAFGIIIIVEICYYPLIDVRNKGTNLEGYTLFTPAVDDIGLELEKPNTIFLIDMNGKVAYRWQVMGAIQLAKLKPNGNIIYATKDSSFRERAGLREIDPFGNVVWYYKCWVNHDFFLLSNGNILINCIEVNEEPEVSSGKILCHVIIEVTPNKDIIWKWRSEEHTEELNELVGIGFPIKNKEQLVFDGVFDWAHNNTCQVIDHNATELKDSRFRAGNIIFSFRNLNTIGVIDKESGNIVWAWGPGILDAQHYPLMMQNGNLIIFDNGTERGYSRIIEFNPLSENIVWEYSDRGAATPQFYSKFTSNAQPLPNGNVFICQGYYYGSGRVGKFYNKVRQRLLKSKASRLFEVNRSNEVLWEIVINLRGDDYDEIGVYQSTRYSNDYVRPLLKIKNNMEKYTDKSRLKSLPYIR